MRTIILLLCLLIANTGEAQSDFRKGYLILTSGDTLNGELDYRGDRAMAALCRYRKADGEAIKEYKPKDLKAFRFENSKFFISKNIQGKQVFLEFLISGKLNVYALRDENGQHYYIDKEDYDLIELPYEEYTEGKQLHQSQIHQDRLRYYLKDAKQLSPQIQRMTVPDRENLVALAKDYHRLVCSTDSCIVYEKKNPKTIILLELLGGERYFPGSQDAVKSWCFEKGILLYFSLPFENENLFIKTGVTHFKIHDPYQKKATNIFKVPIQLEYLFPTKIVQPKISLGCNVYLPHYVTVAASGGLNIKLDKDVSFVLNSEIDLRGKYNSIAPGRVLSYSFSAGFHLKLQ